MKRLQQLFQQKPKNILNIFFTAGYPALDDTATIIKTLASSGVDLVEIGMPYSDPLADGLTIQESSAQALQNGMNLDLLFEQVKAARQETAMPMILMGYFNQVLQYGPERFLNCCVDSGIDGLILPDLPIFEYERDFKHLFEEKGIAMSFLITPQTSIERIQKIDALSTGFIYMVSSNATTGGAATFASQQIEYFKRIQDMKLNSARLIGFGISNHQAFTEACQYANGAIIGSAFIRALAEEGELEEKVENFVNTVLAVSSRQ